MMTIDSIAQAATDLKDRVMNSTAPAQSGEEPPSGIQGKGTATEPYDQGNAPESAAKSATQTAGTSSQPINTTVDAAAASTVSTTGKSAEGKGPGDRGRDPLKVPAKRREEIRDVSPGTLADGTHAQTSGERGGSYEPGKLSRLRGKLPFGKH